MKNDMRILGISGSLRDKSFNTASLKAAKELLPEGVSLDVITLEDIPFFNEDVEAKGLPSAVAALKSQVAAADALLLASPEYNYSIPPVLKNALDWVSRGANQPFAGKPVAIMSASPGIFGGARAQYHLRQVCVRLNMQVLNTPEVFITGANTKFDENSRLTDEYTKNAITKLIAALVEKTEEIQALQHVKK